MWNEYESEALWSNSADPELTLKAIETDWYVLQFASRELLSSREFMLKAVAVEGRALRSASAALRNDREVVLVAVKQFGSVLSAASDGGDLRTGLLPDSPCLADKDTERQAIKWKNQRPSVCAFAVASQWLRLATHARMGQSTRTGIHVACTVKALVDRPWIHGIHIYISKETCYDSHK